MKELFICPSYLRRGYQTYCKEALRDLFEGKQVSHVFNGPSPDLDEEKSELAIRTIGRISLSGAQPKFSVVIGADNRLRYTKEREQGTFILKPKPVSRVIINKDFCCANEKLSMQMDSQVYGIENAANGLCFFENEDSPAYITRRFDVCEKGKLKQEDFAALLGRNKETHGPDYKYENISYEECADLIQKYVKPALIDLRKFFKIILYNFLILNDDAHLKNFSLIEKNGEYRLSPAYDLVNTSLMIREPHIFAFEKGLFKEGMQLSDIRWVRRKDFEEFGKRIGLPEKIIKKEIDFFATPHSLGEELINNSFLSVELKKSYLDSYNFRRKMLTF